MMSMLRRSYILITIFICLLSRAEAEPDPNFFIFLCFGQSNMAGGAKPGDAFDCDTSSSKAQRVKVLAFTDCNEVSTACTNLKIERMHDQWYTAFPPYHNCSEGIGPSDYFGKTLLDSIRADIKIGFIPCALSGLSIKVFQKGSKETIPEYTRPVGVSSDAYGWMVNRCRIAQQSGVIKGILFHQGEADAGQSWWVDAAKGVFDSLKKDLGLGDIPIILGELLQAPGACCAGHNTRVHELASKLPNCKVASSSGLAMRPNDQWKAHFDNDGMKELGRRFARAFLSLADENYVPRTGGVKVDRKRVVSVKDLASLEKTAVIYSLDGRMVCRTGIDDGVSGKVKTGQIYIVKQKISGSRASVVLVR